MSPLAKRGRAPLRRRKAFTPALVLLGLVLAACGGGGASVPPVSQTSVHQTGFDAAFDTLPATLRAAILERLEISPDSSLVVIHADERLEIAYVPANNSFFVRLLDGEEDQLQPWAERFLSAHGVRDFTTIEIVYREAD